MKLWHISQDVNNEYDTYSDAVVAAENEDEARLIHPSIEREDEVWDGKAGEYDSWCNAEFVKVVYIGEAKKGTKKGVICKSFHAG